MTTMTGYWTIDVPVSPAEVEADQELLKQFEPPDGLLVKSAEVVVHGRVWHWREPQAVYGDGAWIWDSSAGEP